MRSPYKAIHDRRRKMGPKKRQEPTERQTPVEVYSPDESTLDKVLRALGRRGIEVEEK